MDSSHRGRVVVDVPDDNVADGDKSASVVFLVYAAIVINDISVDNTFVAITFFVLLFTTENDTDFIGFTGR